MTVLSSLLHRGLTPNQIYNIGPDEAHWWGVERLNVTIDAAMKAANGKCIRLLADDIAQLPVDFFRKSGSDSVPIDPPEWYLYPTTTRWDTWPDHISEVVVSLLSDGNAFIHGLPNTLNPEYLYVLDPSTIDVKSSEGRTVFATPTGKPFGDADVAHIKWVRLPGKVRGLNLVEASKEATGLELAAREWALRFFSNGATLTGVIEIPQSILMTEDAKKSLRDAFEQKHQGLKKSHALGILTGGAKYNPISVKPEDAALPILWQHVLEEAAALYHIPPHMLGSQVSGGQAYASVEQKSIDYVQHAVVPILRRLEAAYSRFLPGDDTFVKFNEKALLRGDFESQARAFSNYLDKKVIRRDEVRAKLDLPPDPAAAGYLETPNNNAPEAFTAEAARSDAPTISVSDVRIADAAIEGLRAGIADEIGTASLDLVEQTIAVRDGVKADIAELSAKVDAGTKQRAAEQKKRDEEAEKAAVIPPTKSEIRRDDKGRIVAVIETRGDQRRVKHVKRDDDGQILSIVELGA